MTSGNQIQPPGTVPWLKLATRFTITVLIFIVICGALTVIYPVKPFWLDEWFIIMNLKFSTPHQLWGKLTYSQQFPRLYIQALKWFTAQFNYNYPALRFPSFLVHSVALFYCWNLSRKVFPGNRIAGLLFIIIYASFNTSIHYFVQVKQYTMEMFLALAAIGQLIALLEADRHSTGRYLLLCVTLALFPFLSYTYAIALAPALAIAFLYHIKNPHALPKVIIATLISIIAVSVFYWIDVRQLLHDGFMHEYWKDNLLTHSSPASSFFVNCYRLFANLGTGDFFEVIFGIVGIASWLYCTARLPHLLRKLSTTSQLIVAYSTLLVWLCIALFLAGGLPLGNHRVNAFMIPAIAIMIGHTLTLQYQQKALRTITTSLSVILLVACGISACLSLVKDLTDSEHKKTLTIYRNIEKAITIAGANHYPILATPGVGYPFQDKVQGDFIVKAQPAYDIRLMTPVYSIPNPQEASYTPCHTSCHLPPSGEGREGGREGLVITTGDSTWILHIK